MRHHFQGRDFLKLADFTPEEIGYLVDTAIELKRKRASGRSVRAVCAARPSP